MKSSNNALAPLFDESEMMAATDHLVQEIAGLEMQLAASGKAPPARPSLPPGNEFHALEILQGHASELRTKVSLQKSSAPVAQAAAPVSPVATPIKTKLTASDVCQQVRAGTMTAAEGNRILNKQRREALEAGRRIFYVRGPLKEKT